jgi:lambda repressor-like predicted transcriptional regulator
MGTIKNEWQDRNYILSWFGKKEGVSLAETARQVGVSTSAVEKSLKRCRK